MEIHKSGQKPKAVISWSSGKDSAYALLNVLESGKYDVVAMLTTVTSTYERVSMHGVRNELLMRQAAILELPEITVTIPPKSSNRIYEAKMSEATEKLRSMGVEFIVFGDIYLEDVRAYRESRLDGTGIRPVFPLWGRDTGKLSREIIDSGISARIVCLDPTRLDRKFGGEKYDAALVDSFPDGVDPCGENGEFHTFVYEAPYFRNAISVKKGESVEREGFFFTDLYPV